jgi:hypothetical protein
MRCANPMCGQLADDVFQGTLSLVELEIPPDARIAGDGTGFPVCTVPSRYFWLCPACSKTMEVRSWTQDEVIFGPSRRLASLSSATSSNGMQTKRLRRVQHRKERPLESA